VLGRELGVDTENLHKFLHEWTDGRFASRLQRGQPVPPGMRMFALHPGDVVLIDEAGMAGTFPLDMISTQMAARLGPLWFGDRTGPEAALQPVHAATLASALIERGDMTIMVESAQLRAVADEPVEATSARRAITRKVHPTRSPAASRLRAPARLEEPMRPPVQPAEDHPRHRL
jgi:hypothetical protein